MYWGIDGCKGGWIAIGLDESSHKAVYTPDISTFWQEHGDLTECLLIDMPIGLASSKDGRLTEKAARDVLQKRRSSVFSVPTREAIEHGAKHDFDSDSYKVACDINRDIEGRAFSKQSWNISAKIHEIDTFLRANPSLQSIILESHPEVLFWSLNDKKPMRYSKKTGLGFMERVKILERYQSNALKIIQEAYDEHQRVLLDDDIVDALACAICSRMGNLLSLPENPQHDSYGLPMQMVYPEIL